MFRKQRRGLVPLPTCAIEGPPVGQRHDLRAHTLDERYVRCVDDAHPSKSGQKRVLLDQIQKNGPLAAGQLQRLRAKGQPGGEPSPKLRIGPGGRGDGDGGGLHQPKAPAHWDYKDVVCKLLALAPQPRAKIDELLLPRLMNGSGRSGAQRPSKSCFRRWLGRAIRNIGKTDPRSAVEALSERVSRQ